ncbi:hypothetical protein BS78_02G039700 [Paspalum vaginatum]|nr:hypothetical protein BS78_02G039700 [Paspalum vaginatum]
MSSSGSSAVAGRLPCVACQQFRRRCQPCCAYALYFPAGSDPDRFRALGKAFGASNVARTLPELPPEKRHLAVDLLVQWAWENPDCRNMVTWHSLKEFKELLLVAVAGRFLDVHRAFGAGYVACAIDGMSREMGRVAVGLLVQWARLHPERSNVVDLDSFPLFQGQLMLAVALQWSITTGAPRPMLPLAS